MSENETDARMNVHVELNQERNYQFSVQFDSPGDFSLRVDEPEPNGDNTGPNPSRLIAAAVGHCLSSSLKFCMDKRGVSLENCSTEVHGTIERNEEGFWRIQTLSVEVNLPELDEDEKEAFEKCRPRFEDYCIATQSIRQGIDVDVEVN